MTFNEEKTYVLAFDLLPLVFHLRFKFEIVHVGRGSEASGRLAVRVFVVEDWSLGISEHVRLNGHADRVALVVENTMRLVEVGRTDTTRPTRSRAAL